MRIRPIMESDLPGMQGDMRKAQRALENKLRDYRLDAAIGILAPIAAAAFPPYRTQV